MPRAPVCPAPVAAHQSSTSGGSWAASCSAADSSAATPDASFAPADAEARGQFGTLTERVKQLETENGKLSEADTAQREELETLTRDNMELRAGARWPEWITGACLLAVGMLMGAIVQSVNGRRARPRIRL